jgi:hypothetical protein
MSNVITWTDRNSGSVDDIQREDVDQFSVVVGRQ